MATLHSIDTTFIGNLDDALFLLVLDEKGRPIGLMPTSDSSCLMNAAQAAGLPRDALVLHVETALKRLHDLAYLGNHPLTQLQLVQASQNSTRNPRTHLELGKAVAELLTQLLEDLRPQGPTPARFSIPQRNWHPYLILHSAYVDGDTNTAIMSKVQVSEGTFNRTRRSALQVVAQLLADREEHFVGRVNI